MSIRPRVVRLDLLYAEERWAKEHRPVVVAAMRRRLGELAWSLAGQMTAFEASPARG